MRRTTPVLDIQTGETWQSLTEAARRLGRSPGSVTNAIRRRGTVAGRHLAYLSDAQCDCCQAKSGVREMSLRKDGAS